MKDVDFDGHLWRGHPPTEVFQEVRGNHAFLYKKFMSDDARQQQIDKWVQNQFTRQIQALEARAPGSRLEWVFTKNHDLADPCCSAKL